MANEETGGMTAALPIQLSESQELLVKQWAADDRLWTTQETVEFNLRVFARAIMARLAPQPVDTRQECVNFLCQNPYPSVDQLNEFIRVLCTPQPAPGPRCPKCGYTGKFLKDRPIPCNRTSVDCDNCGASTVVHNNLSDFAQFFPAPSPQRADDYESFLHFFAKWWAEVDLDKLRASMSDNIWADGKHCGDCTKEPMTCNRCVLEDIEKQAKEFKPFLAAAVPGGFDVDSLVKMLQKEFGWSAMMCCVVDAAIRKHLSEGPEPQKEKEQLRRAELEIEALNKEIDQMSECISGAKMAGYLRQIADAVADSEKRFTAKIEISVHCEPVVGAAQPSESVGGECGELFIGSSDHFAETCHLPKGHKGAHCSASRPSQEGGRK